MNTSSEASGSCLCGKVSITAKNVPSQVHACHCTNCQQWNGGPLFSLDCGQEVTITGEEFVKTYQSSDWAERGFCSNCGSHLFARLIQNQQYYILAGAINPEKELDFHQEFFIERKPSYFSFSNDTKKITGEELFALYAEEHGGE